MTEHTLVSPLTYGQVFGHIARNAAVIDHEGGFPEQEFGWMHDAGLMDVVLPGHPLDFNYPHTRQLLQLLKQAGKAGLPVGRIYEGVSMPCILFICLPQPASANNGMPMLLKATCFLVFGTLRHLAAYVFMI